MSSERHISDERHAGAAIPRRMIALPLTSPTHDADRRDVLKNKFEQSPGDPQAGENNRERKTNLRVNRYLPSATLALAALDFAFLTIVNGAVLVEVQERLTQLSGRMHAFAVVCAIVPITFMFLYATGFYRRDVRISFSAAAPRIPVALAFSAVFLFVTLHYLYGTIFPRALVYQSLSRVGTIVLLTTSISLASVIVSRLIFDWLQRHHWFRRRILVLGTGERASHLYNLLSQESFAAAQELVFVCESIVGRKNSAPAKSPAFTVVDPKPGQTLEDLANELSADEIIIAMDGRRCISPRDLIMCRMLGVPVSESNSFVERNTGKLDLRWFDGAWLLSGNGFQSRMVDVFLKRCLDLAVGFLLLFISAPALLFAMIAIKFDSPGPIFFRQERITRNGKVFALYKLRTMRQDAERGGPRWAAENDPRVTRAGMLLRRWRIDEIPQLWNVMRGDMSLVGPRPEQPKFVKELSLDIRMYPLRHTVRAGLTGWAQVNYPYGATVSDAYRKLEYDLYYIKNFSIRRDILILMQTLRVLIWPIGVR
jgi:sugar transferase (PEP-CTERM system associated)